MAGAGILLDGLSVHIGIDLLNSSPASPGSLALASYQYICDRFVSLIVAYMRCS